jgi:CRISPR/Cas system-associated protein Cas10 (large subunit of type III CRISPR-Cas system)
MNELKRIENERKERERIISHDVQKFVQQQDPNVLTTNNSIQRTASSSSRRSSINQDYLQRFSNSSNRTSTTQKIVIRKKVKYLFSFISMLFFLDNI